MSWCIYTTTLEHILQQTSESERVVMLRPARLRSRSGGNLAEKFSLTIFLLRAS